MSLASVPSSASFLDFETFRNTPEPVELSSRWTLKVNGTPRATDLPLVGATLVGANTSCANAGAANIARQTAAMGNRMRDLIYAQRSRGRAPGAIGARPRSYPGGD